MAQVNVQIAGRSYSLACKEGGEAHLERLAANVGTKAERLIDQLGPMNEPRLMLMAALMLADELHDARTGGPSVDVAPAAAMDPSMVSALETLANRAEALAQRLETPA
jgi:cell division protein ZapA